MVGKYKPIIGYYDGTRFHLGGPKDILSADPEAPPATMKTSPQKKEVFDRLLAFLAANPDNLGAIDGVGSVEQTDSGVRVTATSVEPVVRWMLAQDPDLKDLTITTASLGPAMAATAAKMNHWTA